MTTMLSSLAQVKKEEARSFYFERLGKNSDRLIRLLEEYFKENIQPLYGDQRAFLDKIKEGKDRTCEFLFCNNKPVGVLIYKNQLSDEFAESGILQGLELKTVFLLEKRKKTAGLFLYYLLSHAANLTLDKQGICMFGTVSSQKPDVLKVMCKMGFKIIEMFKDKYIKGVDEYLICHDQLQALAKPQDETTPVFFNIPMRKKVGVLGELPCPTT